jgi:hypothetical protein
LSVLPRPEAEGYLEMLKKRMAEAVPSTPAGR